MWVELIMQQSQHHAVIRNTVVILSSLYKNFLLADSTSMGTFNNFELINKAHKHLRTHLLSHNASIEVALICSLLFYTLECLVGNTQHAIWHLDRGLTLLQRYQDESSLVTIPNFDRLVAVYSRLDVHASVFDNERCPIMRFDLAVEPAKPFNSFSGPGCPDDLLNFERSLTILQNSVMHNLISFAYHKEEPEVEVPLYLIEEIYSLEQRFQQLEIDLRELPVQTAQKSKHCQGKQRKSLVHIEATVFHAVLLEALNTSLGVGNISTEADRRFDFALSQICSLVSTDTELERNGQARQFTLSTNLIAVLYYICMKASNRDIVESALSILLTHFSFTRDGLWDTGMTAGVIKSLLLKPEYREVQSQEIKLEDVGSGIVDTSGGLEEAFRQLKLVEDPIAN
ncbi:hypothetical protein N7452_002126 [Penicillium brevicompactum]|uniref:Uncharacterized protein n=1 Tax=Penicillium brevicompactum TaxID=5074 RepID=A0A9W9R3N6_PENBR|nr:hypothetical protein N7452_002126 [Penicillium brevicompactum]